ncbi:MAG: ABC transporter substrate-binding protein [Flavobacteriales bacterium]|nr:ABC transporter substrate-binding protein [Flavobacteriales bacterium]
MRIFGFLGIILFLYCCNVKPNPVAKKDEVIATSTPQFAKGFQIDSIRGGLKIILFDLEKSGDTLDIIEVKREFANTSCMSTTHLAFFEALGIIDKVKAVGHANLIANLKLSSRFINGDLLNLTKGDEIDSEVLVATQSEILFTYPFGDVGISKSATDRIRTLPISEYLEEHPLGRAEWIKVFGALYNCSAKADSIFNQISQDYFSVCERAKAITQSSSKPTILTASMQGDRWFLPPGNSFMGQLLIDAGAEYLLADSIAQGNLSFTEEAFFSLLSKTEFYTEVTFDPNLTNRAGLLKARPMFKVVACFAENKIFMCNTLECDYFGTALLEPHILLEDILMALHPDLAADYQASYFIPILLIK